MHPDLTTLKIFLAVIDGGSMAKAAEREHISAPAISKRINELEAALGVMLLERQSTGIRPTAAGAALALEARDILHRLDRMQGKLSEYASGQRGKVKILCSPSGMVGNLPERLKTFMLENPSVAVQLDERRADNVVKGVAEGIADIGIFSHHVAAKILSGKDGLNVIPYQTLRLVLVTPKGHPLSKKRRVSLAEAAQYDFVGFSDASVVGALVLKIARERGLRCHSTLLVSGFEALRRMVQADLGIGIIPGFCAVPYAKAMHLGCVPLTDDWAEYRIDICTRSSDTLSMSSRLLLARLTEATE